MRFTKLSSNAFRETTPLVTKCLHLLANKLAGLFLRGVHIGQIK